MNYRVAPTLSLVTPPNTQLFFYPIAGSGLLPPVGPSSLTFSQSLIYILSSPNGPALLSNLKKPSPFLGEKKVFNWFQLATVEPLSSLPTTFLQLIKTPNEVDDLVPLDPFSHTPDCAIWLAPVTSVGQSPRSLPSTCPPSKAFPLEFTASRKAGLFLVSLNEVTFSTFLHSLTRHCRFFPCLCLLYSPCHPFCSGHGCLKLLPNWS